MGGYKVPVTKAHARIAHNNFDRIEWLQVDRDNNMPVKSEKFLPKT